MTRGVCARVGLVLTALGVALAPGCERGEDAGRATSARSGGEPQRGERLLSDGEALLERVRRVDLIAPGTRTTLERGEGPEDWRVVDFDGYPAAWESVVFVTRSLAQLRAIEPRTTRSDRHALLGLVDPRDAPDVGADDAPGAGVGVLVRWFDGAGAELAAVVLGDFADETSLRRSARLAGSDACWLVEGASPASVAGREFVQPTASSIPRGRIGRVELEPAGDDGRVLTIARASWTDDPELIEPPGARLAAGVATSLLDGLAFVPLLEIRSSDRLEPGPAIVEARYRLFEGASVRLRLHDPEHGASEGTIWATLRFDTAAVIGDEAFPNPEGLAAWLAREKGRAHGWAFRVPRESVEIFLLHWEELVLE